MKQETISSIESAARIVLFDQVCRLCTYWVEFLKNHDHRSTFKYVSVQSPEVQLQLATLGYPTHEFHTLVYLDGPNVYDKSTAIIAILSRLGSVWQLGRLLLVIPAPLRDLFY